MYFLPTNLPPSQLEQPILFTEVKTRDLLSYKNNSPTQAFQKVICPWASTVYRLTLILTLVHCLGLFRAGEEQVDIDVYVCRLCRTHQRKVKWLDRNMYFQVSTYQCQYISPPPTLSFSAKVEPKTSCMLGTCSTIDLHCHPSPSLRPFLHPSLVTLYSSGWPQTS